MLKISLEIRIDYLGLANALHAEKQHHLLLVVQVVHTHLAVDRYFEIFLLDYGRYYVARLQVRHIVVLVLLGCPARVQIKHVTHAFQRIHTIGS